MPDLNFLGLTSLRRINNGEVYIHVSALELNLLKINTSQGNPKLCLQESIDWVNSVVSTDSRKGKGVIQESSSDICSEFT